ncbi:MAG: hypothetical protein IPM12_08405 [Flavobacteriales bacterium]|nr:hypothetical protein [Flavobacteriales bacterium]
MALRNAWIVACMVTVPMIAQRSAFDMGFASGTHVSRSEGIGGASTSLLGWSLGAIVRTDLGALWGMPGADAANWYSETGLLHVRQGIGNANTAEDASFRYGQWELPLVLVAKTSRNRLPAGWKRNKLNLVGRFGVVLSARSASSFTRTIDIAGEPFDERITLDPFTIYFTGGVGMERTLKRSFIGFGLFLHGPLGRSATVMLTDAMAREQQYNHRGAYVSMDTWILLDKVRIGPLKRSYRGAKWWENHE